MTSRKRWEFDQISGRYRPPEQVWHDPIVGWDEPEPDETNFDGTGDELRRYLLERQMRRDERIAKEEAFQQRVDDAFANISAI